MIKEMPLCPQWERLVQGSHTPVVLGNGEGWKAYYAFFGRSGFTETDIGEVKCSGHPYSLENLGRTLEVSWWMK